MNTNVRKLTYTAIFTALVCVLTLFTHIPLPLANARYVHLGDAAIFTAGVLCGGLPAAFAGGVGSAFADVFSNAAHWAVPTLIVKSIMGFIVGYFANHEKYVCPRNILVMIIAGTVMSAGYFVTEVFVFGLSVWAEFVTVHFYFIQFISGIIVAGIVLLAVRRMKLHTPFYSRQVTGRKGENEYAGRNF